MYACNNIVHASLGALLRKYVLNFTAREKAEKKTPTTPIETPGGKYLTYTYRIKLPPQSSVLSIKFEAPSSCLNVFCLCCAELIK